MMKSIRGTYKNGTIELIDSIELKNKTNVIITFLDDEIPFPENENYGEKDSDLMDIDSEERGEEYYEKLRKHKRYKAKGNITLVLEKEYTYPLFDYSAGGLSFLSDRLFDSGFVLTAALKYDASGEVLVMEFEITVRRVIDEGNGGYKIGCQFNDDVDEELWHTIMG